MPLCSGPKIVALGNTTVEAMMDKIVDTHRHYGGCVSTEFVWHAIQQNGLGLGMPESHDDVCRRMTFGKDGNFGFYQFLDKFKILDQIVWCEDLIDKSIKSVCDGIKLEGIDYAFLDFSVNKYMGIGWSKREAIRFIYDCFARHGAGKVGLVLSLKYESLRDSQIQYAKLIEHEDMARCLVGIDLVGDEAKFDCDFYKPIFDDWNKANKLTRAHVGESQSVDNVVAALTVLRVSNIAHGFKIVSSKEGLAWALDRQIYFDMTISSNYLAGVWHDLRTHPLIDMHRRGLKVTLGSDDPVICNTTLQNEFAVARTMGLTDDECNSIRHNAVELYRHITLGS